MKGIVTGLGNRSLGWIEELKSRDDAEPVAFVEPTEANKKRAIENGIDADAIFDNIDDAIKSSDADFVMDVTPPAVHHQIAEKAVAAGLHIIGEKPLSDDYATAKKMAQASEDAGLVHMVTQNYRFSAQARTTQKRVSEGLIGKPGQCDVRFYMPWADFPGSHYVTEPFMLINDMMVHHFDLLRFVLGENPVSVQSITWNNDWGWHEGDASHAIVFQYASGLVATHIAAGAAVGSQTGYPGTWRIEGPDGSIDWKQGDTFHSRLHRTDEKVEGETIDHLDVPPEQRAMLDEFFGAIAEKREPECSAKDNLNSLKMVFAAIKSAEEKRPVELAEFDQ